MLGGKIAEFLASVGFQADEKSLKDSLTKVAAFGAAVSVVAGGIYAGIIKAAQGEAELARQAERLGTTSDRLQELGYVAEQSGSSIDAVTRSIEGLISNNPRIRDGAKAPEMAGERMQRMTEAQRRAYAARMGIDPTLIPALTSDVAGLKDEFRQMYAVAGVDAKAAGEAAKGFLAELAKLGTMVRMLARGVSLAFIGKIRGDVEHLRRVIMENFDKIKRLFEVVIAVVLRIAGVFGAFVYRVIKWAAQAVGWFDQLDDGTGRLLLGVLGLYAAWKVLNLGFLATPPGMLITGLLALLAVVDDLLTYMEGGESYFDWGPWVGQINAAVAALVPVADAVRALALRLLPLLQAAFERVWHFVKEMATAVGAVLLSAFGNGTDGALDFVDALGDAVEGLATIIGAVFSVAAPVAIAAFTAGLGTVMDTARMVLQVFSAIVRGIVALFDGDLAGAAQAFLDVLRAVGDFLTSLLTRVGEFVGGLGGKLLAKLGIDVGGASTAATNAGAVAAPMAAPALVPTHGEAANYDNSQRKTEINATTSIQVSGAGDPEAVGNAVATRQQGVNADIVRHAAGCAR
ncbi:hypothetical protein [Nitratidesulfovibrio liaohensis]|uniref:Phage-related protein n=1 Tax=Nitratidesulfovibrio liaohensis TaxID=2604158 RepID=A0ABY9R5D0_9BACT|nr:hypothetical protein [Nitratidesulfovibrio liaohensis]WMW66664.1 hypothetical protein KPS_001268 [Nitratidesulfovibrio liaohensis]